MVKVQFIIGENFHLHKIGGHTELLIECIIFLSENHRLDDLRSRGVGVTLSGCRGCHGQAEASQTVAAPVSIDHADFARCPEVAGLMCVRGRPMDKAHTAKMTGPPMAPKYTHTCTLHRWGPLGFGGPGRPPRSPCSGDGPKQNPVYKGGACAPHQNMKLPRLLGRANSSFISF